MRWFRRNRREDELERELQSHLDLEAEAQQDAGLPAGAARHAARRAFGNPTSTLEDLRAIWSLTTLERFANDLKYAARSLWKSPGFTAVALVTLALGIGANTAIFSVIDALMFRPLPFTAAGQLVRLDATKNGVPIGGYSAYHGPSLLDLRDYARNSRSFAKIVSFDDWRKNVSFTGSDAAPEQMRIGLVSGAYFELLDVHPVLGRLFTDSEEQDGKGYVAAINTHLWQDRFGGDPAILGRKLRINAELYTIVAVMPDVIPEWMQSGRVEIWTPFGSTDALPESSRGSRGWGALARLKPGVSVQQAQADLSRIASALAKAYPVDEGIGVTITRLADTRVGALRPMLFLLAGAVVLILLIACVNLSNLLLARGSARETELAVRTALGSGTAGLVRHLLAETLLLSITGGLLGFALAQVGVNSLVRLQPANMTHLNSIAIDWRVLVFTVIVSLVASLLFGLAPALTSARVNLVDALKQGGRSGTAGKRSRSMRSALVVAEMAMSLMLLVGAGLLVQSIIRLEQQGLGIRRDHLLRGRLYLPPLRYPDAASLTRFADELGRRVRVLPGVVDASVTTFYPPNNGWTTMLVLPGRPVTRIQDVPTAEFGVCDAHLVRTLGAALLRGRDFSAADSAATRPVALISSQFQRRYFPDKDPVGQQIHVGPPPFLGIAPGANTTDSADVSIVGVIGDIRNNGLSRPSEPQIVVLYSQNPLVNYGFKDIVVRTAADPQLIAPALRRQLHELDADIPLADVQTIDEYVERQTGPQRFTTVLLVLFAIAGLVLATIGIYGVVAFLVTQRRRELAVRMAIGASRSGALWLVMEQSLRMAAAGALIGMFGAWAAQKLTSGLLFGISPVDPVTFVGAAVFLMLVTVVASAVPGARVLRIDPVNTLRQE